MHHQIYEENTAYRVAILSKATAFQRSSMLRYYVQPMERLGLKSRDLIGFTLSFNEAGKAPAKLVTEYLGNLLPALQSQGVEYLYVNDGTYFKALTKEKKAEANYGLVLPCAIKGYEHMKVVLGLNYQALIYDPSKVQQMDMGMQAMANHINGTYITLGSDIIHFAEYPKETAEIQAWLNGLHVYPHLAADIEAFSLAFADAGIGSISFAWNQHEGIAFACDYKPLKAVNEQGHYGEFVRNNCVRDMLRVFFETYQGTVTWHNANYDCKVIAYTLWMDHPLDIEGMIKGIEVMTRGMHCTKVLTYLATNSCAGNTLGLKHNAQEFAGNWAKDDIKDIRLIPEKDLLQYNLVDSLSTVFLRDKNYPIVVADKQEDIYLSLFRPSIKQILQTELVGMPMDDAEIQSAKAELETLQTKFLKDIMDEPIIAQFNVIHQTKKMHAANAKLKVKQHPLSHFADETFNPGSPLQLQVLLYQLMELPVIKLTKTKQPATGGKVIKELLSHVNAQKYMTCLQGIRNYAGVSKILAAFMPAFEGGMLKADGMRYLHGSFNLGGTVSGRLSSSDPNMQNLPAGSAYGKTVKKIFKAPPGWLMGGADFRSLEDYISALTTRDPNKLKVYTDGYDGHSLRAFTYFPDLCAGIFDTVISINSIGDVLPHVRQDSKAPTFLLTYGGTYHGLMKNLGWPEEKAKRLEANYRALYKVSIEYIAKRIQQASIDGYVEVAFGLRVRTPMLARTILGNKSTPYEAASEGRTAGNAMGQSYGLLNNRAANEFQERVLASEFKYDVLPIALIHDALYYIFRDDPRVVAWVNKNLVECMSWQELPEIQHDTVKIGADLDLFWPSWAHALTLPNEATEDEISQLCAEHALKVAA